MSAALLSDKTYKVNEFIQYFLTFSLIAISAIPFW
jgi:hypothetical protein